MSQVAHFHYDYTPGGQVARMTQNSAQTTDYTYDGADQLVSEIHAGDSAAYSLGFSYDHNGNRLTQTRGGSVVQSFAYDAHDKLLSGNASGETYGYDANGNQTGLNYYGSFYTFAFDDEDRLTGVTGPNGLSDAFLYNGLGQRTAKTDSTGQYALVSDGAAPAAPVLADGVTVYTPGLSSRKNGSSEFRHGDLLGSLRFLTDANQTVVGDRLFSAFGATVSSDGDPSTPFGWVGDGQSQTDADTGLVLMGHRVYDSRLGRFLSQDPAGAGGNWYAYCGNDPVNGADPSGLLPQMIDGVEIGLPRSVTAPGSPYDTSSGFRFIGVYSIHLDKNGNRMPGETPSFLYNIAVPLPISLIHNAEQAAGVGHNISNMISVGPTGLLKTGLGLRVQQDYYGNHVGHTTVGDLKAGIDQSKNPLLWQEADDAGNFNAGMIGAALGMHEWEVLLSGHVAHIKDTSIQGYLDNGFFDQPRGQQMLHDGYTFYQTMFGH